MNPPSSSQNIVKMLFGLISIVLIMFCIYTIVYSVQTKRSTSALNLSASLPGSTLSISQPDHQAQILGTDKVRVRLTPGLYQVAAFNNGSHASGTVTVVSSKDMSYVIDFTKTSTLPSVQSLTFTGTDALIQDGITTMQLSKLKRDFFSFKRTAKTIAVQTSTVKPGPYDHNSADAALTVNFVVAVDGLPYRASITYSDTRNIRMVLFDYSNGSTVFNVGN